ncbi:hypothetical protein ACHAW6_014018 [Cyclotella cf. meneghiniana]
MILSAYPTVVDNDVVIHECRMAEQRAELAKFKTCLGVKNTTCKLIKNVIDEEWLEALKDKILGFSNVSPLQMLTHLQSAI